MTTIPSPTTPVTDGDELRRRWCDLLRLGPPKSHRSLILSWLRADGTSVPLMIPIDDMPVEVDRTLVGNLAQLHETVAQAEGVPPSDLHLAACLERADRDEPTPDEHAWAAAFETVLREGLGVDCSLHVGNAGRVVAVLPRRSWPA